VYGAKGSNPVGPNGPTAGNATIMNVGAGVAGAGGGATLFEYWANAGNATLLASGGQSGGLGGSITFRDYASGGTALVALTGNATLDISGVLGSTLTIEQFAVSGGTVVTNVGGTTICLAVSNLLINSGALNFTFYNKGVTPGQTYTVLTAPNLASSTASQFTGNAVAGNAPQFSINGNNLQVTFGTSSGRTAKRTAPGIKFKTASTRQPKPAPKGRAGKPASKKSANKPASKRKKRSR
jgi:hypothetical protein